MAQKIRAVLIFEILGKPPEYIKESLEKYIEKMGENKGVFIEKKKFFDSKLIEGEKDIYTSFAEVEIVCDSLNIVFAIVLSMLPASIEIIEPEEIRLKNFELSSVLSELTVKLHKYDEVAKYLTLENNKLTNQVKALEGNYKPRVLVKEVVEKNKKIENLEKSEETSKKKKKAKKDF